MGSATPTALVAALLAPAITILAVLSAATAGCGGDPPPPVDSALVAPGAVDDPVDPPLDTHRAELTAGPSELPAPVDTELLGDVSRHPRVVGWTLVPLLEARHGDRALVVVWPAFDPQGELTHADTPLAFLLERMEGGGHHVVGDPIDATRLRAGGVATHLGDHDYELRERGEGIELELLGEQLAALPRRFAEAVEAGDRRAAVEHAVSFSRLYDTWALGDNVGEAMLLTVHGQLRLTHLSTESPPAPGPEAPEATVHLTMEAPGEAAAEVELRALPLPDATGWVVGRAARPSP